MNILHGEGLRAETEYRFERLRRSHLPNRIAWLRLVLRCSRSPLVIRTGVTGRSGCVRLAPADR